MEYGRDYYTLHFRTEWNDCDNVVISLYENGNAYQIGIVEVCLFKTGKRAGEAFIWNLFVREEHRGKGYGRALLSDALDVAMLADCEKATLEWERHESPKWVYDWYVREGFDESEFSDSYAFMVKTL